MAKGIDNFVSENRRNLRRIDATNIAIDTQRRTNLDFGVNAFEITTSVGVYSRGLGKSLISGHPAAKHGSGRGQSGDLRGEWSLRTDVEESEVFTTDGSDAVADVLAGQSTAAIAETAVGDGSTTASINDSSLASESGRADAWAEQGSDNTRIISRAYFRFAEYGDVVSEYGIYAGTGKLYNRITTPQINPTDHQELRVDIDFDVAGSGQGSSAVTTQGQAAVADALRRSSGTLGLNEMAFGTGTSDPSPSDTTLDAESFRKVVERDRDSNTVTAHVVVFGNEPASQPVTLTEAGVFDNTGRLVWRVVFDGVEKTDGEQLEAFAGFRAK